MLFWAPGPALITYVGLFRFRGSPHSGTIENVTSCAWRRAHFPCGGPAGVMKTNGLFFEVPRTRLSYLAVSKFWIVVETPRNRSDIDRNRFEPVCGHRPGPLWLGFVRFVGRFGFQLDDFRPDP